MVVWQQLLQLVIGSSTVSLGVLLGTYMGGMCLGSLFAPKLVPRGRHPLAVYAGLEAAIGAMGLLLLWGMPLVTRVYISVGGLGAGGVLMRALVAGICLVPPTFAMGATLPVMARWVDGTPEGRARLGCFYAGNLAWADLTLPDPPAALPDWLPALANRPAAGLSLPRLVQLQPGMTVNVPVLASGPAATLTWAGTVLAPVRRAADYALFQVPLTAPAAPGDYEQRLEPSPGGPRQSALLRYSVRALQPWPAETAVLLSNADLVSPAGWSLHVTAPRLCWRLPARVAWRARVVVAGPTPAESDWLTSAACWQPPPLAAGTYYWKVFLQDAQGAQNRPNQRPFAFIVTTRP